MSLSDLPVGIDTDANSEGNYYIARVSSFTDYGTFGEPLSGRFKSMTNYRYGYNGKEYDQEWNANAGAMYDYGFRIYDPRLPGF